MYFAKGTLMCGWNLFQFKGPVFWFLRSTTAKSCWLRGIATPHIVYGGETTLQFLASLIAGSHCILCWVTVYCAKSLYIMLSHCLLCWATVYCAESMYIVLSQCISCWVTEYCAESLGIVPSHCVLWCPRGLPKVILQWKARRCWTYLRDASWPLQSKSGAIRLRI
jgi:hypothetical protein